jgi:hypothetical protein
MVQDKITALYSHALENVVVGLLRAGYGSFTDIRDSTDEPAVVAGFKAWQEQRRAVLSFSFGH